MLAKHTCLVDVGKGEQKLIKREGGAERQWRLTCLGKASGSLFPTLRLHPLGLTALAFAVVHAKAAT